MPRSTASVVALAACCAMMVAACSNEGRSTDNRPGASASSAASSSGTWNDSGWRAPDLATLKDDSLGNAIRRGLALMEHTGDSLSVYVPSSLNCTSCHLERGVRSTAAPLTGVAARFPKFLERAGAVVTLQDRVNFCFTRSLAGRAIDVGGRDMRDIVAYLTFVSNGIPVGAHMSNQGLPAMPHLVGDSGAGRALFASECARCHGPDGAGMAAVPALWGARSFSIGASMAREERAASFIRHNMPLDKPGTLTDQQAFDVAAYLTSHARPDSPEKSRDWPAGGAPYDVPYATAGHAAYHPPPVIPRLGSRPQR